MYYRTVPKLWSETIDQHRRAVREATMNATAALAAEHGLTSLTMSQIAEASGIGRATLYKYFPDVDAILTAWHEQQVSAHLDHLTRLAAEHSSDHRRLEVVLEAYALIQHEAHRHHDPSLALLHRDQHLDHAHATLRRFFSDLISDGARSGAIRDDVPAAELASYCLHALAAASRVSSKAAARRLVIVTLDGLRPPDESAG